MIDFTVTMEGPRVGRYQFTIVSGLETVDSNTAIQIFWQPAFHVGERKPFTLKILVLRLRGR